MVIADNRLVFISLSRILLRLRLAELWYIPRQYEFLITDLVGMWPIRHPDTKNLLHIT